MRSFRVATKVGLVVVLVLAASCSRHEDGDRIAFPALVQSSAPDSLRVTTSNDIIFTLEWFLSNTAQVRVYRIYVVDILSGEPVLFDSTAVGIMTKVVNPFIIIPIPGLVFGVSSVSTGNVESSITFGTAP